MAGEEVATRAPALADGEFRSFALAVGGASYRRDMWTMFSAYFDESGTDKKAPVCVVAGLVSPCKQWERLEQEWQRVLEREGLPYLHMKEQRKLFAGWDEAKVKRFMTSVVNILKRRVDYRVWAVIIKHDYRHIMAGDAKEDRMYFICTEACASRIVRLSASSYNNAKIHYVFEGGAHGSHYAFDAFDKLHKNDKGEFFRSASRSLAEIEDSSAIQAADLHAWEVGKYFSDQINETGRRPRASFLELLSVNDGGGYVLTGGRLRTMADHCKRWLARGKQEVEPIPIPCDRLDRDNLIRLEKVSILDPEISP